MVDTCFGTRIADPYRWLEQLDSRATVDWVKAQRRFTEDYLAGIPSRDTIRRRLSALSNYSRTDVPWREAGRLFFTENAGLQHQPVLYGLPNGDSVPRVVLDPQTISPDGSTPVSDFAVSPDGRWLAYSTCPGGADAGATHVRDLATSRELADVARSAIVFFNAHGTVLDPTLARYEQNAHPKDSLFSVFEPGAAKAPPELADVLNASGSPSNTAAARMATIARARSIIGALHAAGIPIVAGTDLVVPGHSMHRELELEVQAGFTPMEAIQAATIVAARVMGMDRESGSIERGKRADLVILDGDPLANISNVRQVYAVVAAGRALRPDALWRAAGFTP